MVVGGRSVLRAVVGALLLSATLAGCGDDGPVLGPAGGSGSLVLAPRDDRAWTAVFGGVELCLQDDSDRVVITSVDLDLGPSLDADDASLQVRSVGPDDLRTDDRGHVLSNSIPLGAGTGSLPRVGTYDDPVGFEVTKPCGGPLRDGYDDLMVSLDVGPAGGVVEGGSLTYWADGSFDSVPLGWSMTACGDAVPRGAGCGRR